MATPRTTTDPRTLRRTLSLNQSQFWSRIGVTQSGGSRYENGRPMPKPVRELMRLTHEEGIDLTQLTGDMVRAAQQLKATHPDLFKAMAKAGHIESAKGV